MIGKISIGYKTVRDKESTLFPFLGNLLALILFGTMVLGWILRYTDLFPVIGGLLGLGGAFAWIAFLTNIISDNRKKELQKMFDQRCLSRRWASAVMAGVFLIFGVGIVLRYGTVELVGTLETHARRISIIETEDGKEVDNKIVTMAPGSSKKVLLGIRLFGHTTYEIRPDGLPAQTLALRALEKRTIELPTFFFSRPLYIVRLDTKLIDDLQGFDCKLVIILHPPDAGSNTMTSEKKQVVEPYYGRPVWIGVRADVRTPGKLLDSWAADLATHKESNKDPNKESNKDSKDFLLQWTTPRGSNFSRLEPDANIEIKLYIIQKWKEETLEKLIAENVKKVAITGPFPEEIILHQKGDI